MEARSPVRERFVRSTDVPTNSSPRFRRAATNEPGSVAVAESPASGFVSVVIPTLNESRNLARVLPHIPPDYEVIIVDGWSEDGTIEVAKALRPHATIIRQIGHGKGAALLEGFAVARGRIIVTLDADGSTEPGEIEQFVEVLLDGADFAKGSRFLPGGGSSDLTPLRQLGNRFLRRVVNSLYGTYYTDLCYGYNAFWRSCLPYMPTDADGFEIETLMHIKMVRAGLNVVEVPSFEETRGHGESNLRAFRDGFRILRAIWRERRTAEQAAPDRAPVWLALRDEPAVGQHDVAA